jgi:hypothetical protein
MKTNHLLASAAFTAVLVVTLPAHAQLLGGGMHGGVTSMQAATFGSGTGTRGSTASGRTDVSDSAGAGGRVHGVGRVDRTAKAAAQATGRDVRGAKTDAAVAGRQSVAAGNAAVGTTRAAAGTAAATGVSAAGQGEAQARNADTAGAVASGLSVTEEPRTKAKAGSSKPSTSQPARTSKPDSPSTPRHSPPAGNGGETPRSGGPRGEANADASASVSASATH